MNKHSLIFIFILTSITHLIFANFSLSLSESIRSPYESTKPIDYEVTFQLKYTDNLDVYYCQERDNGVANKEYWLMAQRPVYKSIWVAGKRQESKHSDLWLADIKVSLERSGWKIFLGISNIWEYGIYKPKLIIEEYGAINFNFFLTPLILEMHTKVLADTKKIFHEENINFKLLIAIPTNWKLNKYLNAYVKLCIMSKDYGFFRWQQKLMIEINYIK